MTPNNPVFPVPTLIVCGTRGSLMGGEAVFPAAGTTPGPLGDHCRDHCFGVPRVFPNTSRGEHCGEHRPPPRRLFHARNNFLKLCPADIET